jgi:hypothetical protein
MIKEKYELLITVQFLNEISEQKVKLQEHNTKC